MKSIPQTMSEEHQRLNNLFSDFKDSLQDLEKAKKIFNKLKWNFEKHFFIEEKVIFTVYLGNRTPEQDNEISIILKEHKEILWILKKMEEDLEENKIPKTERFTEIISGHEKLEDETLYPRFEEELSEDQKRLIRSRAEEIVF